MGCLIPTTSFFIIALLFTSGLCERTMAMEKGEMKAPNRCLAGLGVCDKACDEACCKQECNNYYVGANPKAGCYRYPGFSYDACICEHDCSQKAT